MSMTTLNTLPAHVKAPPVASEASDPAPDIRVGMAVVVGFCAVLFGWGNIARLDAAAHGSGNVSVSGQRQAVQHRDGGVVAALNVAEGQAVKAGQVLLQLAAADVEAQERSLTTQVITLKAQQARLEAEVARAPAITWPAEFAGYTGADRALAEAAIRTQSQQFVARNQSLGSTRDVLRQRQAQLNQRVQGYRDQLVSADRQQQLLSDQLENTEMLQKKGFASVNTVRALQRAQAQIDGSKADLSSNAASSREQIGELGMEMIQADRRYAEETTTTLNSTLFQLNDLLPKLQAARDQLDRVKVRAPASGKVVGLSIFTVGGVIAPGAELMEIVPDSAPLVIQANFAPTDIDGVRIGQEAEVRFTSMYDDNLPILLGSMTKVSADALTDDKTGLRYYTAEITVPESQLALLRKARGPNLGLQPGIPVDILVPLRKRTAFQYLVEPLGGAFWRSFRER